MGQSEGDWRSAISPSDSGLVVLIGQLVHP